MLEQVWERTMDLRSLQILDLSHSRRLGKIHYFFGLRNLKRLILKGCVSLVDICDSICNLERLVVLDLEGCKKLEKLPRNIRWLESLETLVISGCSNLAEFQDEGTIMKTSLSSSREVKPWNFIVWSWLFKPKRNPETINLFLPRSLVTLDIKNCNLSENSFPKGLSQLSLLRKLYLDENPIEALPESIKTLTNLEYLTVNKCKRLRSMIDLPSSVQILYGSLLKSVERITFVSKPQQLQILFNDSISLSEVQGFFRLEPIGAVDSDLINDLGLINIVESPRDLDVIGYSYSQIKRPIQGLHEFGIYSMYIPVSEVPSWFNDENRRLSSSFTVPSLPNNLRIRGLNVCAVHGQYSYWNTYPSFTKIHNKTKNLTWIYHPLYLGTRNGEDFVWLSHWKFGNQLEGGDEVTVTVLIGGYFQVEEIGINLVYGDREDNVPKNIDEIENDEVISGDLTKFQLSTS